jgi:predicted metalloendopeptidase
MIAINSCKQPSTQIPAIDAANMDTTIAPGDNFYLYANGN